MRNGRPHEETRRSQNPHPAKRSSRRIERQMVGPWSYAQLAADSKWFHGVISFDAIAYDPGDQAILMRSQLLRWRPVVSLVHAAISSSASTPGNGRRL